MIPSRALVQILSACGALGLAASFWPAARPAWGAVAGLLLLAAAVDAVRAARLPTPQVTRRIPPSLPVAAPSSVDLRIAWPGSRTLDAEIFDHHPSAADVEGLPVRVVVPPGGAATIAYRLRPRERGEAAFGRAEILLRSPWGLWRARRRAGGEARVRIYPDFRPVTRYALLAVDNRTSQLGVRLRPRRGEGMELHHLREYRIGDSPRQIDWKATARRLRLISREYQDERDQQVVFLLDCGRAMRAVDQGESHFDHALRSVLLLAYVAIRQGDAVGMMAFGGVERWLKPVKGRIAMKAILDAIHDLETTIEAPDYIAAATRLMARQRRRALVVVISNLRAEDGGEIASALRLMGRRHLVLLASLREGVLDAALSEPIRAFEDALRAASVHHYLAGRRRAHDALRGRGLRISDVAPGDLPVTLVNHYLDLKRAGAL